MQEDNEMKLMAIRIPRLTTDPFILHVCLRQASKQLMYYVISYQLWIINYSIFDIKLFDVFKLYIRTYNLL